MLLRQTPHQRWTYTVQATPGDSFISALHYVPQPQEENQLVPAHRGCNAAREVGLHSHLAGLGSAWALSSCNAEGKGVTVAEQDC